MMVLEGYCLGLGPFAEDCALGVVGGQIYLWKSRRKRSAPVLLKRGWYIPGALPAGRVMHPNPDHEDLTVGAHLGARQECDNLGQQEPAGWMVEQVQRVQDEVGEPFVETEVRRSPRVRKQRREKDFHYY